MANEDKATRYQRFRRRASVAAVLSVATALGVVQWAGPPDWAATSDPDSTMFRMVSLLAGAAALLAVCVVAALPATFYRDVILARRYGILREPPMAWLRDWLRRAAFLVVVGTVAVATCVGLRALVPAWWWVVGGVLAAVAPVGLGHVFARVEQRTPQGNPLAKAELRERLTRLLARAGYPDIGIDQTHVGGRTRLGNAAVVSVAGRRRLLITDTLLADHPDEEVEVVVAHELAHVAHHDVAITQATVAVQAAAVLFLLDAGLTVATAPAGLLPAAWLPAGLVVAGAGALLLRPLGLAVSRLQERRADRYAVRLVGSADALASVVRRMAANHLAEPNPSAWTVWWWHSHPSAASRMTAGRIR